MSNDKYHITDIEHPDYPWLHRIQALRDIGDAVKKRDYGGYVETEDNLYYEDGDTSWLFDDSIACNNAQVRDGSILRGCAIARDGAFVSRGAVVDGQAVIQDNASLFGAHVHDRAEVSGYAVVTALTAYSAPEIADDASVYGEVAGGIRVAGRTVIMPGEKLYNNSKDRFQIINGERSIVYAKGRYSLRPIYSDLEPEIKPKVKPKKKSHDTR